jgi:putative phosphoribosyl transferase
MTMVMDRHRAGWCPTGGPTHLCVVDTDVDIALAGGVVLRGHLDLPAGAAGAVVFTQGNKSHRHGLHHQYVAHRLQLAGLGTLLVDLLAPDEASEHRNLADIPLLGSRVGQIGRWLSAQHETAACRLGYFGAGTGAGAVLWAAAEPDSRVDAVVSLGGRPDLVGERLSWVKAPTLLMGGSADAELDHYLATRARMRCPSRLVVLPGVTRELDRHDTLDEVAGLASTWLAGLLLDEGTGSPGRRAS